MRLWSDLRHGVPLRRRRDVWWGSGTVARRQRDAGATAAFRGRFGIVVFIRTMITPRSRSSSLFRRYRSLPMLVGVAALASWHTRVARADDPAAPATPATATAAPPPVKEPAKPRLPCRSVPVDLAVWNRVSINGLFPPCARNMLGLALGMGRAGELRGVQIGIVGQVAERSARGVQV